MAEKFSKQLAAKAKQQLKQDKEFDDDITEIFMIHFMDTNEMPYGVQKARSDDPFNWTANKLGSMPQNEIIELIDTLTESKVSTISERFQTGMLTEGLTFRERQLRKALDAMMDKIENFERITKEGSTTSKMIEECGGDVKAFNNIHAKLNEIYDILADTMMSCFTPDESDDK